MRFIALVLLLSVFTCIAYADDEIHSRFLDEFGEFMLKTTDTASNYEVIDACLTSTEPHAEICIPVHPPAVVTVADSKGVLYLQIEADFNVTGTMISY